MTQLRDHGKKNENDCVIVQWQVIKLYFLPFVSFVLLQALFITLGTLSAHRVKILVAFRSFFFIVVTNDMSKAFDSLHPPLMLSKLRAYGFHVNAISLLRSYLRDRYNRVRIPCRGCPQGSGTAPLEYFPRPNLPYHFIFIDVR